MSNKIIILVKELLDKKQEEGLECQYIILGEHQQQLLIAYGKEHIKKDFSDEDFGNGSLFMDLKIIKSKFVDVLEIF